MWNSGNQNVQPRWFAFPEFLSSTYNPFFLLLIRAHPCNSCLPPLFPMAKIEISRVAEILKKHKISPALLREIVEELNSITQPNADDDIKPPAPKKQFVVLLSDPAGKLPRQDLTGW